MIHFLLLHHAHYPGWKTWDPDAQPELFADGVGHNLLELHQRLQRCGRTTTIGPEIPRGCTLLVLMPQQFAELSPLGRIRLGWRLRRFRVLSIRSDLPTRLSRFVRVDIEVVPNTTYLEIAGRSARFIPPLPQRGLIARDPGRGDRLTAIGLKSNPRNVPPQLLAPEFTDALDALGMTLDIDSPTLNGGSDQHWHDFSTLDLVICTRADGYETITKPATKLINAWAAGVIPVARREPAYTEIAVDRRDVVFFDRFEELPGILREMKADDDLRRALWQGVAEAAATQPSVEQLLDRWWKLMTSEERPPSTRRALRSIAFLLVRGLPGLGLNRLRRRLQLRRWRRTTTSLARVA